MRLIPAIIQDIQTKQVLMLAYMNEDSLKKSIETNTTWFYSRERKKLWNKGEESGNKQLIKKIEYDCDLDCLLIHVAQVGVACHTGQKSCFYRELDDVQIKDLKYSYAFEENAKEKILDELYDLLEERITNKVENSYTYSLHKKGLDEIIKKLGEESIEVIIAAKHQDKKALIYEIADLLYHLIVLMVEKKITIEEIEEELKKRRKKSTSSNDD